LLTIHSGRPPFKAQTAVVLQFPFRVIIVAREREGAGWLVIAGAHGWLHGDFNAALQDARGIAKAFGLAVMSSAERSMP
jgi:hypothetical protein